MICLTRLNGTEIWLNPLLIEAVERTPDSVVTLTNGHKYVVRETPDAIAERVSTFLARCSPTPWTVGSRLVASERERLENGEGV